MKPRIPAVPESHPQRPNQYQGAETDLGNEADPTLELPWDNITGTPTTLAGYGIVDAYTDTEVDAFLALKADLASPALTGNPTAPTPAPGDNDTSISTTAFVAAAIAAAIAAIPTPTVTYQFPLADGLGDYLFDSAGEPITIPLTAVVT